MDSILLSMEEFAKSYLHNTGTVSRCKLLHFDQGFGQDGIMFAFSLEKLFQYTHFNRLDGTQLVANILLSTIQSHTRSCGNFIRSSYVLFIAIHTTRYVFSRLKDNGNYAAYLPFILSYLESFLLKKFLRWIPWVSAWHIMGSPLTSNTLSPYEATQYLHNLLKEKHLREHIQMYGNINYSVSFWNDEVKGLSAKIFSYLGHTSPIKNVSDYPLETTYQRWKKNLNIVKCSDGIFPSCAFQGVFWSDSISNIKKYSSFTPSELIWDAHQLLFNKDDIVCDRSIIIDVNFLILIDDHLDEISSYNIFEVFVQKLNEFDFPAAKHILVIAKEYFPESYRNNLQLLIDSRSQRNGRCKISFLSGIGSCVMNQLSRMYKILPLSLFELPFEERFDLTTDVYESGNKSKKWLFDFFSAVKLRLIIIYYAHNAVLLFTFPHNSNGITGFSPNHSCDIPLTCVLYSRLPHVTEAMEIELEFYLSLLIDHFGSVIAFLRTVIGNNHIAFSGEISENSEILNTDTKDVLLFQSHDSNKKGKVSTLTSNNRNISSSGYRSFNQNETYSSVKNSEVSSPCQEHILFVQHGTPEVTLINLLHSFLRQIQLSFANGQNIDDLMTLFLTHLDYDTDLFKGNLVDHDPIILLYMLELIIKGLQEALQCYLIEQLMVLNEKYSRDISESIINASINTSKLPYLATPNEGNHETKKVLSSNTTWCISLGMYDPHRNFYRSSITMPPLHTLSAPPTVSKQNTVILADITELRTAKVMHLEISAIFSLIKILCFSGIISRDQFGHLQISSCM